jgi:predicted ABC-type transport system involved in lysophospholipase L1 biosynthesis ATPase subunit
VAGIVPVQEGALEVAARSLVGLGAEERAAHRLAHVGMVFQFGELLDELTVGENVALPLRLRGVGRDEAAARAAECLALVGVSERSADRPATLSGGETQRVGIARALVSRPAVVLADEPTGSLDADAARTVVELLVGLARQGGAALAIVTHDPTVAAITDRIVRLDRGRLHPVRS